MLKKGLTLPEIREIFRTKADKQLVEVLGKRLELSRLVEKLKREGKKTPDHIYNAKAEKERLDEAGAYAQELGINPYFVQAVLYLIIDESCKIQMIQRDEALFGKATLAGAANPGETDERSEELKRNLMTLAGGWAENYDTRYDAKYFATRAHRDYEEELLLRETSLLDERGLALDIGCATGRAAFKLKDRFERVIGLDLSASMITKANTKLTGDGHVRFEWADVEKGIPLEDDMASLVNMNLGTASDIQELPFVLAEARRVLKRGGIMFLSFYNKNALLHQLEFVPWEVSLAAEFNVDRDWLEVHSATGERLAIYAKAYEAGELEGLLPKGVILKSWLTHPTISSILPDVIFEEEAVKTAIAEIDRRLAEDGYGAGAYIVAVAKKTG
ncbi:methyltransferase domain-containing protein [Candidatus Giovannonibacteria bacterium]|nr:methyltransferase domain-containing protein [Candidatus Giovannonibacteria bacterium]